MPVIFGEDHRIIKVVPEDWAGKVTLPHRDLCGLPHDRIPFWLGASYVQPDRYAWVWYPMPINWLVRFGRYIGYRYHYARAGVGPQDAAWVARIEEESKTAYDRGYKRGRGEAWISGWHDM